MRCTTQVLLLSSETTFNGPNLRKFNVSINGVQVLTNYDIYATSGGMNKTNRPIFNLGVVSGRVAWQALL